MKKSFLFFTIASVVFGLGLFRSVLAGDAMSLGVVAPTGLPTGLTVEFLQASKAVDNVVAGITTPTPKFGWIVNSSEKDDSQVAYRILVSSKSLDRDADATDMWDSGKVASDASVNVPYAGKPLVSNHTYYWKVQTWCKRGGQSGWSSPMAFATGQLSDEYATVCYPLAQTPISPKKIIKKGDGHYLIDFGKVAFGYLQLDIDSPVADPNMEVHLAERGDENGVNKKPGGTIRYYKVMQPLAKGKNQLDVRAPVDKRNTGQHAVSIPAEVGVIEPFRYVELVNCPVELTKAMIRQVAVHYPFDEDASNFQSSNQILDDIWALCKYSMKATSFCGVYVDGDRERIPYEADAYINQLSHYAVDREFSIARYSHEYLLVKPTWPTEWKQHSVMMAWTDYMYTGDTSSLTENYDILKAEKTLEKHARPDGLLNTKGLRDIVDWPTTERDGYDFKDVNTVVNAFYYKNLLQMADMAAAIGKTADAAEYRQKAVKVKEAFNAVLFDKERGVYVDGEGSSHASLHANMMPLAFGLVPEENKKSVTDFVVSRGMACSVYGAQYLLEALYEGGRPEVALELMTSKDLRSWYNMLRVGSTITLEAWDNQFKPNQDWNHAWGAAPGNIIPRYLLGIRPLEPGFSKVLIQPQLASLKNVSATVPTIRGPIQIAVENQSGKPFTMKVTIPANMTARVGLPRRDSTSTTVVIDGKKVEAELEGDTLFLDGIGSGDHVFSVD